MIEIQAEQETRSWYRLGGLSIVSALPLDDLCEPGSPSRPDLSIEVMGERAADDYAEASRHAGSIGEPGAPWLEVRRAEDAYMLRWPDQLDVVVPDDGARMLVTVRGELSDSLQRLLTCHAMSFVLPAHGREGLHASAVDIGGKAVVLAGDSGRGKSTLAAALCQRGGRLLADDLTIVRLDEEGVPVIEPASSRVWLIRDIARTMTPGGDVSTESRLHKTAVRGDGIGAATGPVPLAGIYLLSFRAGEAVIGPPLEGTQANLALLGALFNYAMRSPARLALQFRITSPILSSVPLRPLGWEPGPSRAADIAARIVESASAPPQRGSGERVVLPTGSNGHGNGHGNGNGHANGNGHTNGNGHGAAQAPATDRRRLLELLRREGVGGDLDSDPILDEPLLRTSQVAALLRTSDRTIRTWADAGKLTFIRTLGGRRLFPASAVIAVLNGIRGASEEA